MKKQVLSFCLILFSTVIAAQSNDPVIMKVDGNEVRKSEFEYIYQKNNNDSAIDKKSLMEYVDLFKNFKLKVAEAHDQGLDTTANFTNELNEYRTELAKPYLTNFPLNEELIKREYNRTKENLEISHILITFSGQNMDKQDALMSRVFPADTLAAYKKAIQIRKRLLKGENFEKIATEASNDRQSAEKEQPGYLGWFTALTLMPALEDAAFNTQVGQISMPVRTPYGYHLIKVANRKADPGLIRAAHILINCPSTADTIQATDAAKKIDDIYQQILRGEDFGELAKKYSDDKGSAVNGGDLSFFSYAKMVKEFRDAAFAIKEIGEVCPPIRSQFGFHIIKLLERKPLPSLDEVRSDIISNLQRNGSYIELAEPGMEKLKQENGFSMDKENCKKLQQAANTLFPTDSAFIAQFENDKSTLLLANSTPYTIAQFVAFIKTNQSPSLVLSTELLDERVETFTADCLVREEDKLLEKKHPEFRNLMQEYRDGILMFEISNREVWEKAGQDTAGLKTFFEQHKTDYNWDQPHYKGYVILCKDSKTKKKMQKEVSKLDPDSAVTFLFANYRVGDVSYVKVEKGLFVAGDNSYVDETVFKTGKAERTEEYQDFFVLGKLLTKTPEDYTDVRGLVITDYQSYLENLWIQALNKKYPVTIYPEVIDTIK